MTYPDADPNLMNASDLDSSECHSLSFEQVYAKYYGLVLYRARGFNAHDPEATTQEVFIKAFNSFHTYEDRGLSHLPWLLTILRNRIKDEVRTSSKRPGYDLTAEDWLFEAQIDHAAGDDFNNIELQQTLESASKVVGYEFLAALTKSALQGATYAEIAAEHGIKIGTVSSRIYRAVRTLSESSDFRKAVGRD